MMRKQKNATQAAVSQMNFMSLYTFRNIFEEISDVSKTKEIKIIFLDLYKQNIAILSLSFLLSVPTYLIAISKIYYTHKQTKM